MQVEHPKRHHRWGRTPGFEFLEGLPLGLRTMAVREVRALGEQFKIGLCHLSSLVDLVRRSHSTLSSQPLT